MLRILEIGCGQGFHCAMLAQNKSNHVVGIDISEENISTAKKRYPKVDYRLMDVENLTFEDQYFDAIYALDVLEHVDNLNRVIVECNRVLKKGGKFIINVPAEESEKWLLKLRPTYFDEIHHVRIFKNSEFELENLLNGFYLIKKQPMGFIQHFELYWMFRRINKTSTQLGIGTWRDSMMSILIHIMVINFEPVVLKTPLKWIPIWIFTLPVGIFVNYVGNKTFPKSFYYEFVKL